MATVFPRRRALALAAVMISASLAAPAFSADLLATARGRGTLKIAMEGTYPPFNFKDQKMGELAGYDGGASGGGQIGAQA